MMAASSGHSGPKSRERGLERAFAILDYLRATGAAQRPIEIALGMDAPKSSIYELVGILTGLGVLERTDDEGRLFLGRKLHYWGLSYLKNFDITRLARPLLERITEQTRETAQLCMLDGDKYTVVMMNEGRRQFRISSDVGEKIPITWTASGRLLLGHLTDAEILAFIPKEDFVLPDGARLDPESFLAGVRTARDTDFFSFDSLADNYTHCFAAPVRDAEGTCVCTLCVIAPRGDASANYDLYRDTLITAARAMSAGLRSGARNSGLAAE